MLHLVVDSWRTSPLRKNLPNEAKLVDVNDTYCVMATELKINLSVIN